HRHDRSGHLEEGLANPVTLGFVPTQFASTVSADGGRTWSAPQALVPPLVGPSFELCSPVTCLRDGRWILPTSTWRDWHGNRPSGNRMIAFVSNDRGRTWPEYWNVFHHPTDQILYWESKIVELPDGSLVAVAWAYDEAGGKDLPNQFAISRDSGYTWSEPQSTGLIGQTMTHFSVGEDRMLVLYRRMDVPGLWAQSVRVADGEWLNE